MAFPESQRVVYDRNPLYEASVQLRFPSILKITSQPPVDFQEAVRLDFPLYTREAPKPPKVTTTPSQAIASFEFSVAAGSSAPHKFSSPDGATFFRLSNNELALHTRRYDRWESFRSHLETGFEALKSVYRPAFFTHVCVKYKNSIRRSRVGLPDARWPELLKPWVIGPLAEPELEADATALKTTFASQLPGGVGVIDTTVGLGYYTNDPEKAFLIESHVFLDGQTRAEDVFPRLEIFRVAAGQFFRACISDRLHLAMAPRPLGPSVLRAVGQ